MVKVVVAATAESAPQPGGAERMGQRRSPQI